MDYSNANQAAELQLPLQEKTNKLIQMLQKKSAKDLGKLMKLSPNLSELNFERYQNFSVAEQKAAALAFNGEVYAGLNAEGWNSKDKEYANQTVRILSGLYGIIGPYDEIKPYRLEMGTSLKVGAKKSLYEFWGDDITNILLNELSSDEAIVNLASNEYAKSVNWKLINNPIVEPVFKEFKNGDFKTIMVYAKKARGFMADYIVRNKINDLEQLKGFDAEGYAFNEQLTKGNKWVFTR